MTRRTKVIGSGTGLVSVGLVLVDNFGLASLGHSSLVGDYHLSDPLTIDRSSRAVVTDDVEVLRFNNMPEYVSTLDDVRVQGVARGSDTLFLGVAPADAVAGYLDGVAHDEITERESSQDDIVEVVYTLNGSTTDSAAPGTRGFWVASVSGSGEQALDWTIESGEWAVVIMNADGSPGVSADVRFGVRGLVLAPPLLVSILVISLIAMVGWNVLGGYMPTDCHG